MPGPFNYQSAEWKALRARAIVRDGYRCTKCKRPVTGKFAARVDHIVTVKENPALAFSLSNLRTLCVLCDAKRHAEKGGHNNTHLPIGLDGYPK